MERNFAGSYLLIGSGLAVLAITACQVDKIPISPDEEYAREFIKQHGLISKDQDWTYAMRVKAIVDPSAIQGATTLSIYTSRPGATDSYIVARFSASKSEFTFDLPKSVSRIYASATDGSGKECFGRYLEVKDGIVNISAAGSSASRAGGVSAGIVDISDNQYLGGFDPTLCVNSDGTKNDSFWKTLFGEDVYNTKYSGKDKYTRTETAPGTIASSENWEGVSETDWGNVPIKFEAEQLKPFIGWKTKITIGYDKIDGDYFQFTLKVMSGDWPTIESFKQANGGERGSRDFRSRNHFI